MSINVELYDVEFDNLVIKDESFEIYDVEINDSNFGFSSNSEIAFDRDGDIRVRLYIDQDELADAISEEAMIKSLEDNGYEVTKL